MKAFISILFCFMLHITQSQIDPLLEHNWQLEKIMINGEEFLAEPDYLSSGQDWAHINFDDFEFVFVALVPTLTYNDEDSSFTIVEMGENFGSWHSAETTGVFEHEFIANGDIYTDWHNPFMYSFRYEPGFIYLDITNDVGDVATFFTTTLSNTRFENMDISVYPNPTYHLLTVESMQYNIQSIVVYNLQGNIQKQVNQLNGTTIDVSDLAVGLYMLQIKTDQGVFAQKFVKK